VPPSVEKSADKERSLMVKLLPSPLLASVPSPLPPPPPPPPNDDDADADEYEYGPGLLLALSNSLTASIADGLKSE